MWTAGLMLTLYFEWQAATAARLRLCPDVPVKPEPVAVNQKGLVGLNILELGCGTGLTGIIAAAHGANVVLTDMAKLGPLVQSNLLANQEHIARGGGKAAFEVLEWGVTPVRESFSRDFEVVVVGDGVYLAELVSLLLGTLDKVLQANPKAWAVMGADLRGREGLKTFMTQAHAMFDVQTIGRQHRHPATRDFEHAGLYTFRRKTAALGNG